MNDSNHTKSTTLKHPFKIEGASLAETYKLRNMFQQIMQQGSITCYAQKRGKKIGVYLEDGTLFHRVEEGIKYELLEIFLEREKILVGEICSHDTISVNRYFLIKLYYDYISGNHDKQDILRLWIRDGFANMRGITVPKAEYVGNRDMVNSVRDGHLIDDTVDVEMDDNHFGDIVRAIDPKRDGSLVTDLMVMPFIPSWASQVAYYISTEKEPLWLGPSFNADILDIVQDGSKIRGRVVNYRNNYDGTYHFELTFYVE